MTRSVELTEDDLGLIRQVLETYPLQGQTRQVREDVRRIDAILAKLSPPPVTEVPKEDASGDHQT